MQGEIPQELTEELKGRGWKLIQRAPNQMFAVSQSWGCTGTKDDIRLVIMEAYEIMEFIEWAKSKESKQS